MARSAGKVVKIGVNGEVKVKDGIRSLISNLANQRSAVATNHIVSQKLNPYQLAEIVKTGLYQRIVNLKAGHATKSGFNFEDAASLEFYNSIAPHVAKAVKSMVTYGRGIIVAVSKFTPLDEPLTSNTDVTFKSYSADLITAYTANLDLMSPRYMKAEYYQTREYRMHHSRVFDFTYIEPPELDKPLYQYGGISEGELIYNQLIADGVVERAVPAILEKSSTIFYKIAGFKEAIQQHREEDIMDFFGSLEEMRGIYGAGLVDSEDDIVTISQSLANLHDSDMITLRRLAMVTAIPLTILTGEGRQGLNTNTDDEKTTFNEMIETLQTSYVLGPLGTLMRFMGHKLPQIKASQNISAKDKIDYERTVLENAKALFELGEDYETYLNEKGIINIVTNTVATEGTGGDPETPLEAEIRLGEGNGVSNGLMNADY